MFAMAFARHLTWIYNLRITYPDQEIYLGDDDVSGAFRHCKYHPNVVGMHGYLLFGFLMFNTGLTFGDNTSPSNWECIARGRSQLAASLWLDKDETLAAKAAPFLPPIETSPAPSDETISAFTSAYADTINSGVIDVEGRHLPPPFPHHVDDNMYADVKMHLIRTIGASVLALYILLGFPSSAVADSVSWEKFESAFSAYRKNVGFDIDSRRLTVSYPQYKVEQLLQLLDKWLSETHFMIRDLAELIGHLESATSVCRWMCPSFYFIQSLLRKLLHQRYQQVSHYRSRSSRTERLALQLPRSLYYRLSSLVSRDIAQQLWGWKQSFSLPTDVVSELRRIRTSLSTEKWEMYIPHVIKRTPDFFSAGDASLSGGGAYSFELRYYFIGFWSSDIIRGSTLPSSHPQYVHINQLEFIVILLQLSAAIACLEATDSTALLHFFLGSTAFRVLDVGTDNIVSDNWVGSISSTSSRVTQLNTTMRKF